MILEDDNGEEEENFGREIKSAFEIRTSKLQKQIKKLEALAVNGDKPWQMTGEFSMTSSERLNQLKIRTSTKRS